MGGGGGGLHATETAGESWSEGPLGSNTNYLLILGCKLPFKNEPLGCHILF